jgi:hypothetical protein
MSMMSLPERISNADVSFTEEPRGGKAITTHVSDEKWRPESRH